MYLTFDVETYGLYGEAFAVGFVLTKNDGTLVREGLISSHVCEAEPSPLIGKRRAWSDMEWLRANVLPHTPPYECVDGGDVSTTGHMRAQFMNVVFEAKMECDKNGDTLMLAADVPFPCEVSFLLKCLAEYPARNMSLMPYPLIDVASMLLALGEDPVGNYPRTENELPAHNPLSDARQSSRILHQLLKGERVS